MLASMASREKGSASGEGWRELPAPRIAPARVSELPLPLRPLVAIAGRVVGGPPPNIFTTLARHGRLFVPWLMFAGRLMPGGVLPRRESELLILRTAHNCGSRYEWNHHERLGRKAGLTADEIERVRRGPAADGWSERERLLLGAADELHENRMIGEETWSGLRRLLGERELIEVPMLVGHYAMLAGTLLSLGVQPEQRG